MRLGFLLPPTSHSPNSLHKCLVCRKSRFLLRNNLRGPAIDHATHFKIRDYQLPRPPIFSLNNSQYVSAKVRTSTMTATFCLEKGGTRSHVGYLSANLPLLRFRREPKLHFLEFCLPCQARVPLNSIP